MSDQIQFKFGISKLFRTAKCVGILTGSYLDIAAAQENAVPVEGSDTLVWSNEILIVTAGSFELQVPELPSPIALHAGDISSSQRYRSAIKIVATADDSAYTCITPRDGQFWQREAGFVAAGDQITVETPAGAVDAYVFIATGGAQKDGEGLLVGSLTQVTGNTVLTGGATDTHFVHFWK